MYLTTHRKTRNEQSQAYQDNFLYDNSLRDQNQQNNQLVRHSDVMPGLPYSILPPSQDTNTIIEKLMKSKRKSRREDVQNDSSHIKPHSPHLFVLENTEEKIFDQIIGLMDDIQELRVKVDQENQTVIKLEVQKKLLENPGNQANVCFELQKENQSLERCLKILTMRFSGQLSEILSLEKEKYQETRKRLQKVRQEDIEGQINNEIAEIIEINEQIRMKNRLLQSSDRLKLQKGDQNLRKKAQETFLDEQQKKYTFMKDFQKFHKDYQVLVKECQQIEAQIKLKQTRKPESSRIRKNIQNYENNRQQTKRVIKKNYSPDNTSSNRKDRHQSKNLGPYLDLVSQMKSIMER